MLGKRKTDMYLSNKNQIITATKDYVIKTMQNSTLATPQEIAILPAMIKILLKNTSN